MVSTIRTQVTTISAIVILIIVAYIIQTPIKIFALQTAVDNQSQKVARTAKNTTYGVSNTTQMRRSDDTGSKLEPSELEPPDISNGSTSTVPSNPQMVIKLLSSMAPDDISNFPLKNIPKDELLIVLNGLSVQDLFKTLDSIPAADLADILNKLQDKSQAILNRLPSDQSQEIQDRLTSESLK